MSHSSAGLERLTRSGSKLRSLAPKGILPLLIGDPGVGKRWMARAWRDVAGFGAGDTDHRPRKGSQWSLPPKMHRIYHCAS